MSDDEHFDSDLDSASNETQETDLDSDTESLPVGDAAAVLAAKEKERERLQADIEAFLAAGGKITNVDNNVVADPPKKPESSYGSQPI